MPYCTYRSHMTFPTQQQVADYLSSARQGKGFTVKKLADLAGLSPRQVKAKLAGERPITTGDLHRIATALDTTPGAIYAALD